MQTVSNPQTLSRAAGAVYLLLIVLGLSAELLLRQGLVVPGDAAATAANILADPQALRLAFLADALMVAADVTVAVLLYLLLRPYGPLLAIFATAFRLTQAAVLAGNLLLQHTALAWATDPQAFSATMAFQSLSQHAHGYDLGLLYFGISTVLTALLLLRSPLVPRWLGGLLILAGAVYLTGSTLRFVAPGAFALFQPAYGITILAETALAFALLGRGLWGRRRVVHAATA